MSTAKGYRGLAVALEGYKFNLGDEITTAPTTQLNKGDVFIAFGSSTPQIGICYSTAANSLRYVTADTKTFGRTTA